LRVVEEVKKPYQHAYLFDSQENTYKELSSTTAARVSLTLPAGTYNDRFFIVFRNPNLKRDIPKTEIEAKDAVLANIDFFQNNPIKQLEISNPEGYTIKSARVYDMNGKLVIQEKNLGSNNKYSFYTGNLSDGVYLVKLTTSDDIAIDYKVIVHNE
ncbi:MAG: T9SS type A sorting domain-containing protein, partial [Aequorivita sp.]|nr:T9SS type A sorting domain-containing protein [Aequorivita sp.]